jgi:hypothetical protein
VGGESIGDNGDNVLAEEIKGKGGRPDLACQTECIEAWGNVMLRLGLPVIYLLNTLVAP